MIRPALKKISVEELIELAAYYEDILGIHENLERQQALRSAFGLRGGAAWLLSRLAAADGRIVKRDAIIDHLPANDVVHERSEKIVDVHMVHVRRAIGADAIETIWGIGWRLTPLGKLRVRRALHPEPLP